MRYTVDPRLGRARVFDSGTVTSTSETAETLDAPAQGGTLTFKLSCTDTTARCAGFVDVRGIGLLVSDTTRPRDGGVSRNSPVDKALTVTPGATDDGVGLDRAEVTITNVQGTVVGTGATTFTNCVDLSPFAGIDRRLDPSHCRAGTIPVSVNTEDKLRYPEGIYYRTVTVYDAAGNATTVLDREPFEIWHPSLGSAVAQLSIGSGGPTASQPGATGGGRVAGAQASACRSPRLSVELDSKPLRITRGVPVLLAGKKLPLRRAG